MFCWVWFVQFQLILKSFKGRFVLNSKLELIFSEKGLFLNQFHKIDTICKYKLTFGKCKIWMGAAYSSFTAEVKNIFVNLKIFEQFLLQIQIWRRLGWFNLCSGCCQCYTFVHSPLQTLQQCRLCFAQLRRVFHLETSFVRGLGLDQFWPGDRLVGSWRTPSHDLALPKLWWRSSGGQVEILLTRSTYYI